MRAFLFAIVLAIATPCAAQTPEAVQATGAAFELQRAAHEMAAIWRPLPAGPITPAGLTAACEGAIDEMAALDGRLPAQMTVDALSAIRTERGFVMVPTDENPAVLYVFPNEDLRGIASGLASFSIDPSGVGRVVLRDAAGHDSNLEIGHAGARALLRVRPRGSADIQLFVGCASTL